MFKNTIKHLAAACMACAAIMSFTACSSDDNETVPPSGATELYVDASVYTTTLTLKYFKVEVTDNEGNTTELTSSNTKTASAFPKNAIIGLTDPKSKDDTYLTYSLVRTTYKSFPQTMNYVVTLTPRGTKPADDESFNILGTPVLTFANNSRNSGFDKYANNASLAVTGVTASKWDNYVAKYPKRTYTITATATAADALTIEGVKTSK